MSFCQRLFSTKYNTNIYIYCITVLHLSKRFNVVKEEDHQQLIDEVIDYQLLPSSDLPQTEEIDKYWGEISEMIDIFTNNLRFPFLSKIAKLCLVIPVANADSERMFSMMNKIVTEFRSELNNNTVSCLMCTKQNRDSDCYDFVPSKEVLQKAKKACVNYNNSLK